MTWFLSTRLGRLILSALSAIGIAAAVYAKGRSDQVDRYTRRRIEAMREAMEVRDDVQDRSDDRINSDLSKWMRDDK